MICPNCKSDSIAFWNTWLKGSFGCHHCGTCGAVCRVRKSLVLTIVSGCMGGAAGLFLLFRSWLIFGIAVAVGLVIDAMMDYRFRQLDLTASPPPIPGFGGRKLRPPLLASIIVVSLVLVTGVCLAYKPIAVRYHLTRMHSLYGGDSYEAVEGHRKALIELGYLSERTLNS